MSTRGPTRWQRGEEPEFGRIAFFTDAIFAIAMTLLVLDLRIPELAEKADDADAMWDALVDLVPRLISFVVAFYVLAVFWIGGFSFLSRVGAVNRRYMGLTLAYLGVVVFMPFPTSLIGEYEANPISGLLFALVLAVLSGLTTLQVWYAHRAGLMREAVGPEQRRNELIGAAHPGIVFLVSAPLDFIHPTVMLLSWIVLLPLSGRLIQRWERATTATS